MTWLDDYERRARLIPGLLVVLPIAIVIVSLGLREQPVVVVVGGLLSAVGLPVLLANTVRVQGLKVQDRLYAKWGAAPTTLCLRHRGEEGQARRREAWRRNVSQALGRELPNSVDEARDAADADARFDAAVADVRELVRDRRRYPLVFEENRNFGFERNLLGMRPAGIILSGLGWVVLLVSLIADAASKMELSVGSIVIGLVVCLALTAMWLWVPTETRVHRIGFRYAERLLDSAGTVRNGRTR